MENVTHYAGFLNDKVRELIGSSSHDYIQDKLADAFRDRSYKFWAGMAVVPAAYCGLRYITSPGKIRVKRPAKRVEPGEPEVIIVGSGILGSALGAALGKDGRRVTIFERDLKEPDRIVGEFMQPGGVNALKQLGLEDCLLDIDSRTFNGYVLRDVTFTKEAVCLDLPANVTGQGLHHGRFVQQLRKAARQQKTVTYIEAAVTELVYEDGAMVGVKYREKNSEEIKRMDAPVVVVADGIYSKFRKALIKDTPVPRGHFCGVMMHHCPQAVAKHAEIMFSEPSFVLVYQVSTKCTRALVDIPTNYMSMPEDMDAYLRNTVLPKVADHIKAPMLDAIENKRYRTTPLNFLPANPVEKPGCLLLGDALNVRHALTGGGMTVAFNDCVMIRDMLRKIPDLYDYSAVMTGYRRFLYERKRSHAFHINVLAFAFYHILASPDPHVRMLKLGMHRYFAATNWAKRGGAGLLAVVHPVPGPMLMHLSLSLCYAVLWQLTHDILLPRSIYNSIAMLVKGAGIMLPYIWAEIKYFL